MRPLVVIAIVLSLAATAPADLRELASGASIARQLSTGETHRYRLTLARGDFVSVTIDQQGVDLAATLVGPDGRDSITVDAMDDEFRPEHVVAVADLDGIYTLTVQPSRTGPVRGRYTIRLDPPRPASAGDRQRVEAERAFVQGRTRRDANQPATWPEALVDFNAARDRYRSLGDRAGEMKALIEIGVTENYLSRPEALIAATAAERLARTIADRPAIARTLRVLASIYFLAGDFDLAVRAAEEATDINRAVGNRATESHSLNFTAILYSRMGEVEKAIALYEQALPLARATSDRTLEGAILGNLGRVYMSVGDYEKAHSSYDQSLAYDRARNNVRGQLVTLRNMGSVELKLGRPEEALAFQLESVAMARKSGDARNEAYTLNAIGQTYFAAGDYTRALAHHLEALAIGRRLGDVSGQGAALNAAGRSLERLLRHDEAAEMLHQALAVHRNTRERFAEGESLTALAVVERELGHLDRAHDHIQEAVNLDEALRARLTTRELRTTFVAAELNKYELLIDVLQRQRLAGPGANDGAALDISERARARALLDSLLDAHVDLREGIEPALLDRERSLQKQLNDASTELSRQFGTRGGAEELAAAARRVDRLTAEYDQVEARIRRESPHYAAVTQPQPLSAPDIQRSVLDADTVLLEFALGDERSWLWAVTPESITSVELPSRRGIETSARSLYERLTARQKRRGETAGAYAKRVARADAALDRALTDMSQILFSGIARQLNGEWRGKRLAIVAAGALEYLPFAALPVPDRTPAIALLERHEIVTIPSASVLAMMRRETGERSAAARTLAIVADPVFDAGDPRLTHGRRRQVSSSITRNAGLEDLFGGFSRLPFSRDEATAIRSLAGKRDVLTALDFSANRALVLGGGLRGYRVVHFATHGIVNSLRPALSGLIVSLFDERGSPQNGVIRLQDIYNMRLDADLVVLSACETALGKEIKGEGLVGLTRAFMYAGVPRVVASLWQVSDHATAELMTRFYRGIFRHQMQPAAALRAAQRELASDPRWRQPYYWAGFVLQGDWRP